MTHFVRELSDEDWFLGRVVPAIILRNIDEKTKKAVTESGGTWTPSSAVYIGGAGIELQSGLALDANAVCVPSGDNNYVFGDDDYFQFDAPIDRSIQSLAYDFFPTPETMPRGCRLWGVQTSQGALLTRYAGALLRLPIRVIDGSRFTQVTISFRVSAGRTTLPDQMPRARLVRVDAMGNVTPHPSLTTTDSDTSEGWVSIPRPASPTAWSAVDDGNSIQTLTLAFDGDDGEEIDRSVYDYAVEWEEERGGGAFVNEGGNYLFNIVATFRSSDLQPY